MRILVKAVKSMQKIAPHKVGIAKDMSVHFKLPLSFFTDKTVVAHGQ